MNFNAILQELKAERDRFNKAIAAIEGLGNSYPLLAAASDGWEIYTRCMTGCWSTWFPDPGNT